MDRSIDRHRPPPTGHHPQMLEFDPKTSHYYFFNARTGESRWTEEADFLMGQQVEQQVRCVAFGVVVTVCGGCGVVGGGRGAASNDVHSSLTAINDSRIIDRWQRRGSSWSWMKERRRSRLRIGGKGWC